MLGMTRYSEKLYQPKSEVNGLKNDKYPNKSSYEKKKINESSEPKSKTPVCVWNKKVPGTELEKLKKVIEEKYNKHFDSYWDLHKWSVENFVQYWEEIWNYIGLKTSEPYDEVYRKTGEGFIDCEWFPGAKFNFAENILRIRDDTVALICVDETGTYEEYITFAEMFEEVKLYAAAFRKHGLQKGDVVACYMANRKECIYTFLAATSIGALFGGPHPYLGPGPASNIISKMEPKFLISVDYHRDMDTEYQNFEYLPEITANVPSLEKVLILRLKTQEKQKDISNIRNGCWLEDFLASGRNSDGDVPDIVFEQLPFNHPICLNFTSGTTGLPKGPVHSAGSLLTHLVSVFFFWNLKKGDTILTFYPVGWTLWDTFIPCLARGVRIVLYTGSPFYETPEGNLFDVFAKYKVNYCFLATAVADKFEKKKAKPKPTSNIEHLKFLTIGGSPVKPQNCVYITDNVKKDAFVASQYGASESFGTFSGFDLNLPCHAGEVQAPSLGMDVRCFDEEGNSVVNKRGDMVLATPTPTLPIYLWKDEGNKVLKETYLSKHPGVWCQSDEIWINPVTKGIVVIGRSDDTLVQNGDRFGAGDVYFAIHEIEEIQDAICVGQTNDAGDCRAVLFLKMKEGYAFTPEFKEEVIQKIFKELWFDCVPEVIVEVKDIPYNLNNKKMESVVRKIIATNQVPKVNNIKNPECLTYYCDIPELVDYNKPKENSCL